MAEATISNPTSANNPLSSSLVGRAADGAIINCGTESYGQFRANAAIAKGEVVAFNSSQTAGTPIEVVKMPTAADPRLAIGIATNAVAAGGVVTVCTQGYCEVYVNAQTVAYGDVVLVPGTNAGEASCSSTDPDATVIVGRVLGTIMAAKVSGTNLALAYIKQV